MKTAVLAATVALATPALASAEPDPDTAVFDHPDAAWWLSGQINIVGQAQPGFHAPYTGTNSFRSDDHAAVSDVVTLYAGYELTRYTAIVVAGESAGGGGLSNALGIAGFTNLDVVRNPTLGATPYIGRAFIDQVIPLSDDHTAHDRDPLHILRTLPARRLEIRAGKLSTADIFDVNTIGSDSHLQFLNWALDNNAAYDYAADTRGYSLGATIEYAEPRFAVRFGELLMPSIANGIDYDYDLANARGENLELEVHDEVAGRAGTIRLLGYENHANMGNYAEANAIARIGEVDVPDIASTRRKGRTKYGLGLNAEHELGDDVRAFLRVGWSDGANESFAYTEADNTVAFGGDLRGAPWGRAADKLGLGVVSNGISRDHRDYLALGGLGFLLGDGALSYGREMIGEAYYNARVYRGIYVAADFQLVVHPGYNTARGPVEVGSLRLHADL